MSTEFARCSILNPSRQRHEMMAVAGWLLVRSKTKPHVALPVPRQAFMGLTRAVSYSLQTITEEQLHPQQDRLTSVSWRDRCWQLAAADPAVAIWLAAEESEAAEPSTADNNLSAARAAVSWLERLEESLVTSATPQGAALLMQAIPVSVQELHAATGMLSLVSDASEFPGSVAYSTAVRWRDQIFREVLARPAGEKRIPDHEVASILSFGQSDSQVAVLNELLVASKSLRALFVDFSGSVSSARLEAIRELAYGAGHEINNPLANIAARAQALLYDEHEPERQRRLAIIVDQAFRARDMIGGLMLLARPPQPHRKEVHIAELLQSVFASIGRLLAAIVQYHARHGELEKDNIRMVIHSYLENFKNALERRQRILKRDHWGDELEKLIMLHAWDWALYWKQKEASIFPTKHFDEFIQQIKKFLGCNTVSTDPEDGNSSLKRQRS